jgi:hypothetical protein
LSEGYFTHVNRNLSPPVILTLSLMVMIDWRTIKAAREDQLSHIEFTVFF